MLNLFQFHHCPEIAAHHTKGVKIMAILNAGDVFTMEAKYLKAGMHIIRNDQELALTMVEYNLGQDYPSVDYFFQYVDEELKEDEAYQGEFCNFFCPDEMVKVIYIPGLPYPIHAINV